SVHLHPCVGHTAGQVHADHAGAATGDLHPAGPPHEPHGSVAAGGHLDPRHRAVDRKSTRLNSSHVKISYAVFCLKKKSSLLARSMGKSSCASTATCSTPSPLPPPAPCTSPVTAPRRLTGTLRPRLMTGMSCGRAT